MRRRSHIMEGVDWSQTPHDLLESISKRLLTAKDFLNSISACKSWLSIVSSIKLLLVPPPLLLTVQQPTNSNGNKENASNRKYFLGFTKRVILNGRLFKCIGFKFNWIVIINKEKEVHILNPFTKVQFDLPSQSTLEIETTVGNTIHKVVLSHSPLNKKCVAVAVHHYSKFLVFARPGEQSWTRINRVVFDVYDVLFFQSKLYAVTGLGMVNVYDFHDDPRMEFYCFFPYCKGQELYLAELSGQLLIVKCMDLENYKIYMVDFYNGCVVHVQHLRRHALFLGCHSSVSMLATDLTRFRGNRIYFRSYNSAGNVCLGVFHMKKRKVVYKNTLGDSVSEM